MPEFDSEVMEEVGGSEEFSSTETDREIANHVSSENDLLRGSW